MLHWDFPLPRSMVRYAPYLVLFGLTFWACTANADQNGNSACSITSDCSVNKYCENSECITCPTAYSAAELTQLSLVPSTDANREAMYKCIEFDIGVSKSQVSV